jgi:hypothetical protein
MGGIKQGIEASLKSRDTEETLDIWFNRPIGYLWTLFFMKLNVHPNVVTILSIILGMAAGYMFYFPDMSHTVCGILLLMWANFYDSADGQLARLTGKKTRWGRMLDGFAGDIWFFCIYLAICLRLTPQWGIWIWLVAALSGLVCHSKQCALADYYRNIHLYFLKGESASELDNFKQQREIYRSLPWRHNVWWKWFLFFYGNYTRSQERMTPRFQQMFALWQKMKGTAPAGEARAEFIEGSRPLMKYCNFLTFNARAIALYVSMLAGMPYLYFIFELTVMNAVFFYMRSRHERLSSAVYEKLSSGNGEERR